MSANRPNKNTALATNQKAIKGVRKHFAKVKTLTLAGTSFTPSELKRLFEDEIEGSNALDTSRAQLAEQTDAVAGVRAKAQAARKGLRAYILGNYGAKAVQVLEDFGMSPPKTPGPKTAAVTADSAMRGAATRKARKEAASAVSPALSTAAQVIVPGQAARATTPAQTAAPAAIDAAPKQ